MVMDTVDGRLDAHALLKNMPPPDRIAATASLSLTERNPPAHCPAYLEAVRESVAAEPPPFGTEAYANVYRDLSADDRWLTISLISNAQREGQGAGDLWSLAACAVDGEEQQLVKRHAVDESRHALIYLAILDLVFPDAVDPTFRKDSTRSRPASRWGRSRRPSPDRLTRRTRPSTITCR